MSMLDEVGSCSWADGKGRGGRVLLLILNPVVMTSLAVMEHAGFAPDLACNHQPEALWCVEQVGGGGGKEASVGFP